MGNETQYIMVKFLKDIYNKYNKHHDYGRGVHFEQTCIGYELQKKKKYVILSNKFNAIGRYREMIIMKIIQ